MSITGKTVLAIALVCAAYASLACERPASVVLPNGMTSSEQDMRDANAAVQAFMGNMQSYLDCLEEENGRARLGDRAAGRAVVEQRENAAVQVHNAAVKEMEDVAAEFDQAVADYRSRN